MTSQTSPALEALRPEATPATPRSARPSEEIQKHGERGLTLVELLVVILLLGLIGGGVGVTVIRRFNNAKVGIAETKVKEIASAIQYFQLENNNQLPESLSQLKSSEGSGPYFTDSLLDPWNNEYLYKELSGGEFDIVSLGEDGEPGGEGRAKDISFMEMTQSEEESGF